MGLCDELHPSTHARLLRSGSRDKHRAIGILVGPRLSSRVAARVEGKSFLARLAIGIHVTAPTIHAGFNGPIQLEICNHGPLRVKIVAGMRVCQLIFEQTLGTPAKGYAGQFLGQIPK